MWYSQSMQVTVEKFMYRFALGLGPNVLANCPNYCDRS